MTEYKENKIKSLRNFVNSILKKRFKRKNEFDQQKDRFQDLIFNLGPELYGKMFYTVLNELDENIDLICDQLFFDHSWRILEDLDEKDSKLAQFIAVYSRSEVKIARAAGIEKGRFNRVKNNKVEDLYAFEVYGLAKAFGLKPSQLFDYFYGHGERPIVGV